MNRPAHPQSDTHRDPRPGILVVDDEPGVGALLSAILEREGYRVWLADSGAAAFQVFQQHANDVDLVLLDLQLPDMCGCEALRHIRRLAPAVRCCFMSALPDMDQDPRVRSQRALGILHKPLELLENVHTLGNWIPPRIGKGGIGAA